MNERRTTWAIRLLPAATFVVGLLLGAVVVLLVRGESESPPPDEAGSMASGPHSSSAAPSGDTVITVPLACKQASAKLQEASDLLRSSLGAVRTFEPDTLIATLRRLETLDRQSRPLLRQCSAVDVTTSPTSSAVSPSGSPTSTP